MESLELGTANSVDQRDSVAGEQNASVDVSKERTTSILVLYCGGTIGMTRKNGVYVPEPNFLVRELRKQPVLHDQNYCETQLTNEYHRETLVMPVSKEGRRVLYQINEYEPLLDSSNMTYDDYIRLASDIQENYTKYDGFVILHGTDTMAYTASALSFMLENLGKPVILTGSQIPIFEPRSDGLHNFIGSLIMASSYCIPEVTILFDSVLLRGNRSTKLDNGAFNAFDSPNMAPLAKFGISVSVDNEAVFRNRGIRKFQVHNNMNRHVGVLRLFPGITEMTIRSFMQPPIEGVVLQTYGEGNGPTARADIMSALRDAAKRGVIIVNTTQCLHGIVLPMYAAGKELADIGVIAGSDMTVEAALMKLSYILGKDDWSLDKKRQMIGINLRGELTTVTQDDGKQLQFSLINTLAEAMRLSSSQEIQLLRSAMFPHLLCASSREGNTEALEKLRQAGAEFDMSDYDGRTALHVACREGHENVVKYLLDRGASVHVRDRYGHSALDFAILSGRYGPGTGFNVIRMLRKAGAHLTITPPTRLTQIIFNVVASGDGDALECWAEAGADVANLVDDNGRTALHIAAEHGHVTPADHLIHRMADPLRKDSTGLTPIDVAKQYGHDELAALMQPVSLED